MSTWQAGGRQLLRASALSMLHEPPDHAPYGWSHCLTMPQAVLGVAAACADPTRAFAVAATHVVGFRAALGQTALPDRYEPEPPGVDLVTALRSDPSRAATAMWHTPTDGVVAAVTDLAGRAAVHHDAHLVKYTLACLDAADWDREHARLYRSAAAALHTYWTIADQANQLA